MHALLANAFRINLRLLDRENTLFIISVQSSTDCIAGSLFVLDNENKRTMKSFSIRFLFKDLTKCCFSYDGLESVFLDRENK